MVARANGFDGVAEAAVALEAIAAAGAPLAPLPTAGRSVISVGAAGFRAAAAVCDNVNALAGIATVALAGTTPLLGAEVTAGDADAKGLAGGSTIRIAGDAELGCVAAGQVDAEITLLSVVGCVLVPPAGAAVGALLLGAVSGAELCGKLNPPGGE